MLLNYTVYKRLRHNIENVIPNVCEASKNLALLETRCLAEYYPAYAGLDMTKKEGLDYTIPQHSQACAGVPCRARVE